MAEAQGTHEGKGGVSSRNIDDLVKWFPVGTREAVASLPERQRHCVLLVFVDGATEQEAAQELGITRSVVNVHLIRAKQKLEKMLQPV